jgi:hypothetical protein
MSKHDMAERILLCIAAVHEKARSEPQPPQWRRWDFDRWQINQEFGPAYSTLKWFGDLAASERDRVRCLRWVYRLREAGLVETFKDQWGSKLERVRLTTAGSEAVTELQGTAVPAGS